MALVSAAVVASDVVNHLPMPTWAYAAIAAAIFATLCIVMWSYRDVANRHSHKAAPDAADHAGAPGAIRHGAGHPSSDVTPHSGH